MLTVIKIMDSEPLHLFVLLSLENVPVKPHILNHSDNLSKEQLFDFLPSIIGLLRHKYVVFCFFFKRADVVISIDIN